MQISTATEPLHIATLPGRLFEIRRIDVFRDRVVVERRRPRSTARRSSVELTAGLAAVVAQDARRTGRPGVVGSLRPSRYSVESGGRLVLAGIRIPFRCAARRQRRQLDHPTRCRLRPCPPVDDIALGRPDPELRSLAGLAVMLGLVVGPILALQDAVDTDASRTTIVGLVLLVVVATVAGLSAVAWTIELRRVQVHADRVTVQRRRIVGRIRQTEIAFGEGLSAVVVEPARRSGGGRPAIAHHGRWWEVRYGARPVIADITTAADARRIAEAINTAARCQER